MRPIGGVPCATASRSRSPRASCSPSPLSRSASPGREQPGRRVPGWSTGTSRGRTRPASPASPCACSAPRASRRVRGHRPNVRRRVPALELGTYYVSADAGPLSLGAFYPSALTLAEATPIVLTEAAPTASAQLLVLEAAACGWAPRRDPTDPGSWRPASSPPAMTLSSDGTTVVAGEPWIDTARVFAHTEAGWRLQGMLSQPVESRTRSAGTTTWTATRSPSPTTSTYNGAATRRQGLDLPAHGRRLGARADAHAHGRGVPQLRRVPRAQRRHPAGRRAGGDGRRREAGRRRVRLHAQRLHLDAARPAHLRRTNSTTRFGHAVALQGSTAVIAAPPHGLGRPQLRRRGLRLHRERRGLAAARRPQDQATASSSWTSARPSPSTPAPSPSAARRLARDRRHLRVHRRRRLLVPAGAPDARRRQRSAGRWATRRARRRHHPRHRGDRRRRRPGYAAGVGYVFRRTGTTWHQDAELRGALQRRAHLVHRRVRGHRRRRPARRTAATSRGSNRACTSTTPT